MMYLLAGADLSVGYTVGSRGVTRLGGWVLVEVEMRVRYLLVGLGMGLDWLSTSLD